MKKFFKDHQEWTLVWIALICLAVVAAYAVWTVRILFAVFDASTRFPDESAMHASFDISGAEELGLGGLEPTDTVPVPRATSSDAGKKE